MRVRRCPAPGVGDQEKVVQLTGVVTSCLLRFGSYGKGGGPKCGCVLPRSAYSEREMLRRRCRASKLLPGGTEKFHGPAQNSGKGVIILVPFCSRPTANAKRKSLPGSGNGQNAVWNRFRSPA